MSINEFNVCIDYEQLWDQTIFPLKQMTFKLWNSKWTNIKLDWEREYKRTKAHYAQTKIYLFYLIHRHLLSDLVDKNILYKIIKIIVFPLLVLVPFFYFLFGLQDQKCPCVFLSHAHSKWINLTF